jgi:dipeptidyl-peptidase-4
MTTTVSSPAVPLPGDGDHSTAGKAGFLREFSETRGYLLGRPTRAVFTPSADALLFLRSPARSSEHDLYELDLASGKARLVLRASDLRATGGAGGDEELSPEEQARRERMRIVDRGFAAFALTPDGASIVVNHGGQLFVVSRATGIARALTAPGLPAPVDPRVSHKGGRIAYVSGGNVHVLDLVHPGALPQAITEGATEDHFFGLAEFVAQEEMARFEGMWWSPDGTRLAYAEVDQRHVERFAIADPARPERAPQIFAYPRTGTANAVVKLHIANLGPGATNEASGEGSPPSPSSSSPSAVVVLWDHDRYPYLARVVWDAEGAPLAILVQTRDQREAVLLAVDLETGRTSPLVTERDPAWVNLERDLPRFLPGGAGLLWATEGQGARALELRTIEGTVVKTLIGPGDGFLSVVHVVPDASAIFVLLGDALTSHLVRVDLATGARTTIIPDDGCDRIASVARHGTCVLETRQGSDRLPETRVLFPDGREVMVPAVAVAPPFRVNLTLTRTGGPHDFHAAIIRPAAFDPGQRYPVILHVYGGPHSLMVRADERHYLLDQWLADKGAVVVAIDNRGTPRRGRAWERAIKSAFGDVPLDDQVAGLTALAARFPELDLERVGVYGWSYGGYLSALAALRRPDFFKVAVAGAPVVDWLDYDTHYTERYMDLPDAAPAAYRGANLLTYARDLARPLLLIHGTADDNVYFFHSLKLADALVRAGRPFDFLPLARVTHQLADPAIREAVWNRVATFLFQHLRGPSPASG